MKLFYVRVPLISLHSHVEKFQDLCKWGPSSNSMTGQLYYPTSHLFVQSNPLIVMLLTQSAKGEGHECDIKWLQHLVQFQPLRDSRVQDCWFLCLPSTVPRWSSCNSIHKGRSPLLQHTSTASDTGMNSGCQQVCISLQFQFRSTVSSLTTCKPWCIRCALSGSSINQTDVLF